MMDTARAGGGPSQRGAVGKDRAAPAQLGRDSRVLCLEERGDARGLRLQRVK